MFLPMILSEGINWLNRNNETELEYALRGKAWKVYWFLLKNGAPVGVREVQRALHFSSPSIAFHHLEQLRELGLVEKQEVGGHYVLGWSSKNWCASALRETWQTAVSTILLLRPVLNRVLRLYLALMVHSFTRDNLFIISFGAIVCANFLV